jgi:hypothetical protein
VFFVSVVRKESEVVLDPYFIKRLQLEIAPDRKPSTGGRPMSELL